MKRQEREKYDLIQALVLAAARQYDGARADVKVRRPDKKLSQHE